MGDAYVNSITRGIDGRGSFAGVGAVVVVVRLDILVW